MPAGPTKIAPEALLDLLNNAEGEAQAKELLLGLGHPVTKVDHWVGMNFMVRTGKNRGAALEAMCSIAGIQLRVSDLCFNSKRLQRAAELQAAGCPLCSKDFKSLHGTSWRQMVRNSPMRTRWQRALVWYTAKLFEL
jgi:hypothetical protein